MYANDPFTQKMKGFLCANISIWKIMSVQTQTSSPVTLRPLLELELNGETNLNTILNDLSSRCQFSFRIISAQLEYIGNANFGQMQLHLLGDEAENQYVIDYFDSRRIRNAITSYASV